jgi:hypothetical protein
VRHSAARLRRPPAPQKAALSAEPRARAAVAADGSKDGKTAKRALEQVQLTASQLSTDSQLTAN